jgi:hypothetical protein
MTTSHTRASYTLGDLVSLRPPSQRSKPPEPAKPKVSFSVAKDAAIRHEFKKAGCPEDAAESFLEVMPDLLASMRRIAGEYDAKRAFFKALRLDRDSRHHILGARKALGVALDELSETKNLAAMLAGSFQADMEAIHRTWRTLQAIGRSLKADQRRQRKLDFCKELSLKAIADFFWDLGLPPVTTPDSLFPSVARIVLKRWDKDIHPRDLSRAVNAARAERRWPATT